MCQVGDRCRRAPPGRTGPDDSEGEQRCCRAGSVSRSASSNAVRTLPRMAVASSTVLRPGAKFPVVMAEIAMARAGCEDQCVIWHSAFVGEAHGPACRIDAGYRRKNCGHVFSVAEH